MVDNNKKKYGNDIFDFENLTNMAVRIDISTSFLGNDDAQNLEGCYI